MRTNEIENGIDESKKLEEKIERKDLKYETKEYAFEYVKEFSAI